MSRTRTRNGLAVLSAIASAFLAEGNTTWNDEGILCLPVKTYEKKLGTTKDNSSFLSLAKPNPDPSVAEKSVKEAYEQFQESLAGDIKSYEQLTPYTEGDISILLYEISLDPIKEISWHPFYTRLLSNVDPIIPFQGGSISDIAAFFVDQNPATTALKKRAADFNFIKLKAPEGEPFLPTDQAAFTLANMGYKDIAVAIFANPKFFGGGTNDKANMFYMNSAQEERTFLCFPGLFATVETSELVRKVTWSGRGDTYEPFNKEKSLAQGALPRYRYCQGGSDKDLAPGSEIIAVRPDGTLEFKEAPHFSTFAIKDAHMYFVSTTEVFDTIKDKHGKPMCAYNPIEPLGIDLIFTAALDLFPSKLPINTFVSTEYLKALIEDLKTQMDALNQTKSKTFITGNIGCGIFGNDPRVVALAYAYVFMYHSPETLKNVAITDGNFYNTLKTAWTTISETEPIEGEPEEALIGRIFENAFPTEDMAKRQLNFGQRNLCPPNTSLAEAFDTLKSKNVTKELLEARLTEILEDPACEEFKNLKDRSGKTLEQSLNKLSIQ